MASQLLTSLVSSSISNITAVATQPIMHSLASVVFAGGLAVQAVLSLANPYQFEQRDAEILKRSVDTFIQTETPIALANILCNIGADGACAQGANPGIVVASPDKTEPTNYFYTWSRDAALVFKCITDIFVNNYDPKLQTLIEQYISSQAYLQTVSNPSGSLADGSGLGEAKFYTNETEFTGAWGRPQRDGPALRATAMITYSKWLLNNGYNTTARNVVWPVIKNDLAYVAQYWNNTGFDLWEEVQGSSFFTIAAQHRALIEGNELATLLGLQCPACKSQAPQILCFLQTFWSPSKNYLIANTNNNNGRNGLDANTLLGVIHQFDPEGACGGSPLFSPCSDYALANHKAVTDSFRNLYAINKGIPAGTAVSVGRYPEDNYMTGNPWYLNTLAAAEQLYDALYIWNKLGSINITQISLPFFKDFLSSVTVGNFLATTSTYQSLYSSISTYADGYVNIVGTYAFPNGSMSEQFDKVTGKPLSAYDLTWSYASFLTAAARRAKVVPYSWSQGQYPSLPSTCSAGSAPGTYTAAPTPTWPINQTPPGYTGTPTSAASTTSAACTPVASVSVTFNELAQTNYGDSIKVVGSISQLGSWAPAQGMALSASEYTAAKPLWRGTVLLPAGQTVQYKYVNVKADGTVVWEKDPNHSLSVPKGCSANLAVSDSWQ